MAAQFELVFRSELQSTRSQSSGRVTRQDFGMICHYKPEVEALGVEVQAAHLFLRNYEIASHHIISEVDFQNRFV